MESDQGHKNQQKSADGEASSEYHTDTTGNENQAIQESRSDPKVTNSYFCFECGAIMTTAEDKRQHDLAETVKETDNQESP